MISNNFAKALSKQVNAEFYSAYLYLSMSAAADKFGLKGVANWLYVQAQEEMAHGTHMFRYILERGAAPSFEAIGQPPESFTDVKEIFEMVHSHERKVTESVNALATLAMQENDHAGYNFVMWYVNEQVEEEANVTNILDRLGLIGNNNGLLLTFDNELAARIFVNPFPKTV